MKKIFYDGWRFLAMEIYKYNYLDELILKLQNAN